MKIADYECINEFEAVISDAKKLMTRIEATGFDETMSGDCFARGIK